MSAPRRSKSPKPNASSKSPCRRIIKSPCRKHTKVDPQKTSATLQLNETPFIDLNRQASIDSPLKEKKLSVNTDQQCCSQMITSDYKQSANTSPSKSNISVQRLKFEMEIGTDDLQDSSAQTPSLRVSVTSAPRAAIRSASMMSLVRWNIDKVLEKNPDIDLKIVLNACHSKLEREPCTGRLCMVRPTHDSPIQDRHVSCALLAWQALGETDVDRLIELGTRIRDENKMRKETFRTRHETVLEVSTTNKQKQVIYPGNAVKAFCCPNSGGGGFIGHRSLNESCSCSGAQEEAKKEFYERLMGPVIKLPDTCSCPSGEVRMPSQKQSEVCCNPPFLDLPGCLEGGCMERLRALDTAVAALRERAERLSSRDADRAKLLKQAEAAWIDMERAYKERLKQVIDKEDDTCRRIKNMIAERNRNKCECATKRDKNQALLNKLEEERKNLSNVIAEGDAAVIERAKLTAETAQREFDLHEAQCRLSQLDRDLKFSEEQERRKLSKLLGQLDAERALTRESDRALRTDLSMLRDQFSIISERLLDMDDTNKGMIEKIAQIKSNKDAMIDELETCKQGCDAKMAGLRDEIAAKKEELDKLKVVVVECSCKRPREKICQVKRSPSLVAMCRCDVNQPADDSCSCTSLRTRMMSDMLRDLFTGLQQEMADGCDAMSCELLKCLADDYQWDKNVTMKQKLKEYFTKFLNNELDIAIYTAMEDYHARWAGQSCVDARRAAEAAALDAANMTSCVCTPGSPSNPGVAEQAWQRTQADVYQLAIQLNELKQESIRRTDLKTMEENLSKMVERVVKPRTDYVSAETETPLLQPSDEVCYHMDYTNLGITPFTYPSVETPEPRKNKTRSTSISKKTVGKLRQRVPLARNDPCNKCPSKQKKNTEARKNIENKLHRIYASSLTSVDIKFLHKTVSPPCLSQYSRLLNMVSLEDDIIPQLDFTYKKSNRGVSIQTSVDRGQRFDDSFKSRELLKDLSTKILQGCSCNSGCHCFNRKPSNIDIDVLMRQMFECCKLASDKFNMDNEIKFDVEKKTSKTHINDRTISKDIYKKLIRDCLKSCTTENNLNLSLSEQILSKKSPKYSVAAKISGICFGGSDKVVNIFSVTQNNNNCSCSSVDNNKEISNAECNNEAGTRSLGTEGKVKGSEEPIVFQSCDCDAETPDKKSKVLFKSDLPTNIGPSTNASEFMHTINLDQSDDRMCACPGNEEGLATTFVEMIGKLIRNKICSYKKSLTSMFSGDKPTCRCEDKLGPYLRRLREQSTNLKKQLGQSGGKISKSTSNLVTTETVKMQTSIEGTQPEKEFCIEPVKKSKNSLLSKSDCNIFLRKSKNKLNSKQGSISSRKNSSIQLSTRYSTSKYHKYCARTNSISKICLKEKRKSTVNSAPKNMMEKSLKKRINCKKTVRVTEKTNNYKKLEVESTETSHNSNPNQNTQNEYPKNVITQNKNNLANKNTCHCKKNSNNNNKKEFLKTISAMKSVSEIKPCCCDYKSKLLDSTIAGSQDKKIANNVEKGDSVKDNSLQDKRLIGGSAYSSSQVQSNVPGILEDQRAIGGGRTSASHSQQGQMKGGETKIAQGQGGIQFSSGRTLEDGQTFAQGQYPSQQSHGPNQQDEQATMQDGKQQYTLKQDPLKKEANQLNYGQMQDGGSLQQGKMQQSQNREPVQSGEQKYNYSRDSLQQGKQLENQVRESMQSGAQKYSSSRISLQQSRQQEARVRESMQYGKQKYDSRQETLQQNRETDGLGINKQGGVQPYAPEQSPSSGKDGVRTSRISKTSKTDSKCENWCDKDGKQKDVDMVQVTKKTDCECMPFCGCDLCNEKPGVGKGSGVLPSNEDCVCCPRNSDELNNPATAELEANAFQLLQTYVQCKLKKMKCDCCPHDEAAFDENARFSAMRDKIKEIVRTDIARLVCRCQQQEDMKHKEKMAFTLLEEYIRSKINDVNCTCVDKEIPDKESLYQKTFDNVKDIIQSDLGDLSCCCKECACIEDLEPNLSPCRCIKEDLRSEADIKKSQLIPTTETVPLKTKMKTSKIDIETNTIRNSCSCQTTKGTEPRSYSKSEIIGRSQSKTVQSEADKCECTELLSSSEEKVIEITTESHFILVKLSSGLINKENEDTKLRCPTVQEKSSQKSCVPNHFIKRIVCTKAKSWANNNEIKYTIPSKPCPNCQINEPITSICPAICPPVKSVTVADDKSNTSLKREVSRAHKYDSKQKVKSTDSVSKVISFEHESATSTRCECAESKIIFEDENSGIKIIEGKKITSKCCTTSSLNISCASSAAACECSNKSVNAVMSQVSIKLSKQRKQSGFSSKGSTLSCQDSTLPCTCSTKSSNMGITKKSLPGDRCECSMVPLCQVKLLVNDIDEKLQLAKCTCETLSKAVCPVHAITGKNCSCKKPVSNKRDSCTICKNSSSNLNVKPDGSKICNLCNCVDKL